MHWDSSAHFGGSSAHSSISVQTCKQKQSLKLPRLNQNKFWCRRNAIRNTLKNRSLLYLFVVFCKVQPNTMNLFARVAIGTRWTPISGTSVVAQNTNISGTRVSFITLTWKRDKSDHIFFTIVHIFIFNLLGRLCACFNERTYLTHKAWCKRASMERFYFILYTTLSRGVKPDLVPY